MRLTADWTLLKKKKNTSDLEDITMGTILNETQETEKKE